VKKRCVIIQAENFKNDMALWRHFFPIWPLRAFKYWNSVFLAVKEILV
jgi:hypothetical protein